MGIAMVRLGLHRSNTNIPWWQILYNINYYASIWKTTLQYLLSSNVKYSQKKERIANKKRRNRTTDQIFCRAVNRNGQILQMQRIEINSVENNTTRGRVIEPIGRFAEWEIVLGWEYVVVRWRCYWLWMIAVALFGWLTRMMVSHDSF